jgi:DHA1 family multidrug resistance protein-like MFS transporter
VKLDLGKNPAYLEKGRTLGHGERRKSSPTTERQPKKQNRQASPGKGDRDFIPVRSEGDDDPLNPLNWTILERTKNMFIICFLVFTQAWAGAAESRGNLAASQEFHVSKVAENLATAVYLFGVGTGALFVGPISETVGRNPTYLVGSFCYLCFVLGSALTPTFGGQVICRYLAGLSASATLTINGASVNDQFCPVKRALVFPIIAWVNVAGKQAFR